MSKYTAEELMEIVKNLDNEDRIKFLQEMFYEYFNPSGLPRAEIEWN